MLPFFLTTIGACGKTNEMYDMLEQLSH